MRSCPSSNSFELTDEGELQDYLGTRLTNHPDGRIELQQKKMIDKPGWAVDLTADSGVPLWSRGQWSGAFSSWPCCWGGT